jgi:UDP-2,4-diacetamido-2,4,6-trideoxy-beta-L-altropyranose hydrolase
MPTVLFRCDGGPELGIGHVMRCRALAAAFRDQGWSSAFAMSQASAQLFGGDDTVVVADGVAGAAATRAAMIARNAGCLVVDHYGLDAEFERQAANTGALVLAVDDLANRAHDCDLLVDSNPVRTASNYAEHTTERTQLLLGARYALLRPEFAELRRTTDDTVRLTPRRLLAAPGGADPGNISSLLLDTVPQLRAAGLDMTLIVGNANPRQADLVARGRAIGAEVVCDPRNAVALMAAADIAISGAGTTCLEFACLGIPTVALILADNQRAVAKALSDAGAARVLDAASRLESDQLADAVIALASAHAARGRMSAAGQALIDGKGATRVAGEAVRLHALRKLEQCL